MNISNILTEFHTERERIMGRRTMSAVARKRIFEAAKRRWAKQKKAKKA
jgi:hypothetical protein